MALKKKQDDQVLEELHENVAAIFDQVQTSMANHKKNCVALHKLHIRTAEIVETVVVNGKKSGKGRKEAVQETMVLVGEQEFQDILLDMISRVLDTKKGTSNVDRVVKYVGAFVRFMNEKLVEAKTKKASSSSISTKEGKESDEEDDEEENSTSRLVARLLTWLLEGFLAKNKNVRYRCIQIVAEMISHLGEIDEDTYHHLRESLVQRLNDKESLIRAHAAIAMSKLVGSEDEDELPDGEQSILQCLLESLATDPAAEVRRATLMNVPLAPATIDALLNRTRDVDAVTRKLVYTAVIGAKLEHPRQLSIAQRELIVKDGLGDREPAVRVAAGKVVAQWLDWVMGQEKEGDREEEDGWRGDDGGVMKGLIKFLGLFDVIGPGEAVAVDALLSILTTKQELLDSFVFPEAYWRHLTPESIVLARVFVEYCISSSNEARLETSALPVVTAFAFIVQEAYNNLLSGLEEIETAKMLNAGLEDENEEANEQEEELAKREVVMGELLRLALKLDYGDEIGRRKVFMVIKDMLAHPQLPPSLIERCLDIMKEIMPSERDLIRVIVEIIVELRDGDAEEPLEEPAIADDQSDISTASRKEKSTRKGKDKQDMTPKERQQADMADIRCLLLCIAMLERVNGTFEDNSTLEGILGDLIIPSVKRKELAMREKALVSLGLCCLIARNMALSSFQLFLSQAQNAPPELKVQVLKVIMDLLIMYDQEFFGKSEETAKQIVEFLLQLLEAEESTEAQAILVTGLCKLLLSGIVTDSKVLVCLALMYVSPTTADCQEIRQCLAYFFPVYSYSSLANQDRVRAIFVSTFDLVQRMYEDLDDDQEMITPQQFGLLMVDWTNPEKAAEIATADMDHTPVSHANLAVDILIALYDSDRTTEEQKILLQLLGQLHLERGIDLKYAHKLDILVKYHEEQCPLENGPNEKLFDKFKKRINSLFADDLKENKVEIDEDLRDLYQQIGVEVPEEGDDDAPRMSRKARGKRRATDEDDEDEDQEDEDDQADEDEDSGERQEDEGPHDEFNDEATPIQPDEDASVISGQSKASDPQEENTEMETEERNKSPTPPPKSRKAPTRKSSRQPSVPARPRRGKSKSAPEHEVEDASPQPDEAITATPTKKGVKRIHTPGSGVNSPANRKRTRVKAPRRKPPSTLDVTPTNSDIESPPSPTPKKAARRTRGQKASGLEKKNLTPPPVVEEGDEDEDDGEEDEDDADEVASMIVGRRSTPPSPATSDDFGGY